MPIVTTHSVKLAGSEAVPILVECSVEPGIGIHLVGLADATVKESLLRVVTALQANGFTIPGKKIIINLAPSDLRKEGSGYDLAVALALVAASEQDGGCLSDLRDWLVIGELGLDGSVREVPGTVQAVQAAIGRGCKGVIIPKHSGVEVVDLFSESDIPVYEAASLTDALSIASGKGLIPTIWDGLDYVPDEDRTREEPAWNGIKGNHGARRAIEIAAAGGHHLLLVGADGSGKGVFARALRDLLPPMSRDEALEVAAVYSAAGKGAMRAAGTEGVGRRPLRTPWHGMSVPALLGGGPGENIMPGEVSLATQGVLYLDEFAMMPKSLKEGLRGPLEDGQITISRLRSKTVLPTRFQLVASSAPCPCGHYGHGDRCTCTQGQRAAYLSSLSGPVLDRIDLQAWITPDDNGLYIKPVPEHDSDTPFQEVAARVAAAREAQRKRFGDGRLNAGMTAAETERFCHTDGECQKAIETIIDRLGLSARAYSRILKIARTIADLDGREDIGPSDIAEASSYRFLDRRDFIENGNERGTKIA